MTAISELERFQEWIDHFWKSAVIVFCWLTTPVRYKNTSTSSDHGKSFHLTRSSPGSGKYSPTTTVDRLMRIFHSEGSQSQSNATPSGKSPVTSGPRGLHELLHTMREKRRADGLSFGALDNIRDHAPTQSPGSMSSNEMGTRGDVVYHVSDVPREGPSSNFKFESSPASSKAISSDVLW